MKHALLTTAIITTTLFFASCKKSSPSTTPTDRVKTYTEDVTSTGVPNGHEVDSFMLNYDANGRLISLVSVTTPPEKIVYTYTSSTSFTMDLTANDGGTIHDIAYLKGSLIDSSFQYNNTNDTTTDKYIYNANGQLVQTYDYFYSAIPGTTSLDDVTTDAYDVTGNLTTETDTDYVTNYTYYTDMSVKVNPYLPV